MIKASFILFGLLLVAREIKSDDGASASVDTSTPTGGEAPPAAPVGIPPGPNPGPGIGGGFGGLPGGYPGGFLGFPGVGFSKSLNINAGAGVGPYFGGVPPVGPGAVPPAGGIPPPADGGLGIGDPSFGGFGGFTPSYLPSTWLGSALGAKGDFLFPCVIVIFFIVGVWVVIQFLLTLLVPFIGMKMGFADAITKAKSRRSTDDCSSPEYTAQNITDAIEKNSGQYS